MVGLIIAFPSIVSSGLEKKQVIDLDKVKIERPIEQNGGAPRTDEEQMRGFDKVSPPAPPAGDAPLMPTPIEPTSQVDDPMKAILDAVQKDEAKK